MAANNTGTRHHDVRYAVASRDWGLRRVRRLTFGIAGAGAAAAVLLAAGFDVHAHQARNSGAGGSGHAHAPGGGQHIGGGQAGQIQAPPNNPLPAGGSGQVVSGGS